VVGIAKSLHLRTHVPRLRMLHKTASGVLWSDAPVRDHGGQNPSVQASRLQKCGGSSINKECSIVQQMLKRVRLWKNIVDDYQPLPLPDLGPGKSLTEIEEEAWFSAAAVKPGWRVAYLASLVSVNTSAGPSEILHLKLENVRLDADPPEIRILNNPKNKYRIRHVPLNEKAKWAIEQLLRRAKELGATEAAHYLIPFRVQRDSYDPVRPATSWKNAHEEICTAAGIRIRPYDFRHTAITRMLESGAPERTVMAICGHVSPAMIARYSHIQMESKLAAVQRILGEPQGQPGSDGGNGSRRKKYLRVMINCPVAGKLVYTGTAADEREFKRDPTRSGQFTCLECKQVHSWTKADTFLLP
jgi:Phage integrase family